MLTGSQRNGLGDTIREETCSCGLTRWQHADLAASYILSIKATNKLVHEKIYFSADVSYFHLSLLSQYAAGREEVSADMSVLCPSPDRLKNPHKGRKNVPICCLSSHLCHCGSWDADKDRSGGLLCGKGTKEFSKPRPFSSSPLHLFLSDRNAAKGSVN